jgi:hypothetical protein
MLRPSQTCRRVFLQQLSLAFGRNGEASRGRKALDGRPSTLLDDCGFEFESVAQLKDDAIKTAEELLRSLNHGESLSGEPWKLWVTDGPNDTGKRLLELEFTGRFLT